MTEQQYKRASKVVLMAIVIVFGYIAVTVFAWLASNQDTSTWKGLVQAMAAVLVIIVSAVAHVTKSGTREGAVIMETSMAVGYVIISLLNSTPGT